jgi:hypothetical protein
VFIRVDLAGYIITSSALRAYIDLIVLTITLDRNSILSCRSMAYSLQTRLKRVCRSGCSLNVVFSGAFGRSPGPSLPAELSVRSG